MIAGGVVVLLVFGASAPAWASPSTEVVQGRILRLVSVADWGAAGSLLSGQQVAWDVAVSADAPDPAVVTIALTASGDAPLVADVSMCMRDWGPTGCPGGAVVLQSAWELPLDGSPVVLTEVADSDVAHVRLTIGLRDGVEVGSTTVLLHARRAGETVAVGPDGGLASTGLSPLAPWILAGGSVLIAAGLTLVARRRGRQGESTAARRDPGGAP